GGSPGTAGTAPAASTVVLNEFLTNSGSYTFGGVPADFVELRNTGAAAADVSGWILRADPGNLIAILPPGTSIAPGAYLTIHAAAALPAPDLAGNIESGHGTIQIFNAAGIARDGVRYGPQAAGYSFNRLGSGWQLGTPTPGAATAAAPTEPLSMVRLNEWFPNPRPGDDDWLELYHTGSTAPVVLTGCTVEVNGARSTLTGPSALLPASWARFVMDPGSARGDALLLNLPASGTALRLIGTAGETVDSLTYSAIATNISGGRLPDGTATLNPALNPSPGFQNAAPTVSPLIIGEVLVRNTTGPAAPWARRPSWVEISNLPLPGTQSLDGWKLRTVGTAPATWNFPAGMSLAAGSHLRLWCDPIQPASLSTGLNLNAGLDLAPAATWGLELIQPSGHVAQSLLWGAQIPDRSFGYTGSAYALLTNPTPGAANAAAAALDASSQVRLNEWFGGDSAETSNFVEIFHPGSNPVDLGGLWLGDAPSESGLRRWQIPALSFIAPQKHLLLTASGPAGSPAVLGFDIARGGEFLRLSANDAPATAIDEQNFPTFSPLVSQGRLSDGTATLTSMNPTPGFTNAALGGQLITAHPESLVTSGRSAAAFSITAPGATSWQWKFNGVDIPGAINASFSVLPWATPATAGVYTCTVSGPSGNATSNPAVLTVLNNFSTFCAINNITANPGADADGDGLSNAVEFLTGSDPRVPASPALSNFLVQPVFQSDPGGKSLGYDLALDPNAVYSNLRGNLSADLTLWETRAADSTVPIANGSRLLWNIPAGSPRYFLRLWLDE
ncbi:MAG: putative secreted protein, partial [Verrucomicrobiales bacterium]|nr:putative secreted protein [Verrucomicrobiales bacterium]